MGRVIFFLSQLYRFSILLGEKIKEMRNNNSLSLLKIVTSESLSGEAIGGAEEMHLSK